MNLRAGNLDDQLQQTRSQSLAAADERAPRTGASHGRPRADLDRADPRARPAASRQRAATGPSIWNSCGPASALGNQISALESRPRGRPAVCDRGDARRAELDRPGALADDLTPAARAIGLAVAAARRTATGARRAAGPVCSSGWPQAAKARRELAAWRERHTGAHERATVLEELERRLEGLSSGVQRGLLAARENTSGPLPARPRRGGRPAERQHGNGAAGRSGPGRGGPVRRGHRNRKSCSPMFTSPRRPAVRPRGVVRLDVLPALTGGEQIDLTGPEGGASAGPIASWKPAPNSPCWPNACWARPGSSKPWPTPSIGPPRPAADLQFVTQAGELVAADGTLVVGPRQSATGLISRRAELRALTQPNRRSGRQNRARTGRQSPRSKSKSPAASSEPPRQRCRTSRAFRPAGSPTPGSRQRPKNAAFSWNGRRPASTANWPPPPRNSGPPRPLWPPPARGWPKPRPPSPRSKAACGRTWPAPPSWSRCGKRPAARRALPASSWPAASSSSDHLKTQQGQLERDQQERVRALADAQNQLTAAAARARHADRNILAAESAVAELFLRKEVLSRANVEKINRREASRQLKIELAPGGAANPGARLRKLETRLHDKELAASEVRARAADAGRPAARGLRHRSGRAGARAVAPSSRRAAAGRGGNRRSAAQDRQHRRRESGGAGRTRRAGSPLQAPCRRSTTI